MFEIQIYSEKFINQNIISQKKPSVIADGFCNYNFDLRNYLLPKRLPNNPPRPPFFVATEMASPIPSSPSPS